MSIVTNTKKEILPPPSERPTASGWLLRNLFNNWYNSFLTIILLALVTWAIYASLTWAFTAARWEVVPNNMRLFMVGLYPSSVAGQTDFIWRIWLVLYLLAGTLGLTFGAWVKHREIAGIALLAIPVILAAFIIIYSLLPQETLTLNSAIALSAQFLGLDIIAILTWILGKWLGDRLKRFTIILWLLYFPLTILVIRGFGPEFTDLERPLATIPTRFWGGLLLSLILSIVGIVFSFPIGVMLALGRQSKLPVLRTFSVIYIEFIRGVPLISLLFMGQVMLNLFIPGDVTLDRVIRAMVPITLFSAAYLAENVRGGLQSIPRGQYEAAHALGLSGFHTMTFIILPQALRAVIPVLVGQFIALFKDTTLVSIVGLLDLVGIAQSVLANPEYVGTQREVYLFLALIYFVFSYALSYTSRRMETALGVGTR